MLDLIYLVSFLVLGAIGWITYRIYIYPYYLSPLRKIPGPPSGSLLYGNIQQIFINENDTLIDWKNKYGNVVKYYGMFNRPSVLISDAKMIQEIAVNDAYDYVKPRRLMGFLLTIAGNGILFAEGEDHKRQRKMMNPAFSHNNIKEMLPVFNRISLTLKGIIEKKINAGESEINLTNYVSKATLDIIGLVGFDYEFNSLTSPNELAEAYDYLMNIKQTTLRLLIRITANYFPYIRKIPIEDNVMFNKALNVIKRSSKEIVEEKYRKAKIGELNGKDLLSLLINTNKTLPVEERMTDEELRNQIMTFLLAGHETTSVSICWTLHLLSENPHEQDLLREELVKAFPDKSKFNPTFDEINSLEYLNCIVKETLRFSSPVTALSRTNNVDKVLGGYHIPKETPIMLSISTLHKSTSIWGPTADKFDPKRWLDPSLNVSASHYLPFYAGPRTCIGNKLSLAEYKILLSTLVRNFVFQPVEGFKVKARVFPVRKPYPYLALNVSKVEG